MNSDDDHYYYQQHPQHQQEHQQQYHQHQRLVVSARDPNDQCGGYEAQQDISNGEDIACNKKTMRKRSNKEVMQLNPLSPKDQDYHPGYYTSLNNSIKRMKLDDPLSLTPVSPVVSMSLAQPETDEERLANMNKFLHYLHHERENRRKYRREELPHNIAVVLKPEFAELQEHTPYDDGNLMDHSSVMMDYSP